MRIVIQRVSEASVSIKDTMKSAIQQGFLILLGVGEEDNEDDIEWLVKKVVNLRVFDDEQGIMNKSILDVNGEILVVSQFTLMASYKKGNRPSYIRAGIWCTLFLRTHQYGVPHRRGWRVGAHHLTHLWRAKFQAWRDTQSCR